MAHLVKSLGSPVSLEGIRVVVDCANGAAFQAAPAAFEAQGAEVHRIHAEPDGININESPALLIWTRCDQRCWNGTRTSGSLSMEMPTAAWPSIRSAGLSTGIRSWRSSALALREQGRLKNDTVVATVMSNLGLINAMRSRGITVEQNKVGDRYVLEAMRAGGFILGGEQSGHIVMLEHATTGDGVLTALHLMNRTATSGRSLAQLASVMTRLPQVLINVPDVDKDRATTDPELSAAVVEAEAELGESGRVLLRPSGTESLVRVMVEAESYEAANGVAHRLADAVRTSLAL